ncbi:ParB/RepB/Spo0J family partition protein [Sulfobacillus thermosulfidooxidans]|uniref:ParB/RepB/Spo0J family partition protein n=1 Tax=Sulfobacillus thermosulfidooxidans TaxID=28034 RepID=UPI0002DC001C|nr:ParB/RepB/Spo0J family partition protein [Sulfobacillus thermosulfidooxidans]
MKWIDPRQLIPTQELATMIGQIRTLVPIMQEHGYDVSFPIEVLEFQNRYYVLEGHHRLAAAMLLGINPVPIVTRADLPGNMPPDIFVQDIPVSAQYDFEELWGKEL